MMKREMISLYHFFKDENPDDFIIEVNSKSTKNLDYVIRDNDTIDIFRR